MQDKLIITGIPPYDGEHEFDMEDLLTSLTMRELHQIKVTAGVRAGELMESLKAGDSDLIVAFTMILLQRKGKRPDAEVFWDAPAGSGLLLMLDPAREKEAAADDEDPPKPLDRIGASEPPIGNGGSSSSEPAASPGTAPSPIGTPASETLSPVQDSVHAI